MSWFIPWAIVVALYIPPIVGISQSWPLRKHLRQRTNKKLYATTVFAIIMNSLLMLAALAITIGAFTMPIEVGPYDSAPPEAHRWGSLVIYLGLLDLFLAPIAMAAILTVKSLAQKTPTTSPASQPTQ